MDGDAPARHELSTLDKHPLPVLISAPYAHDSDVLAQTLAAEGIAVIACTDVEDLSHRIADAAAAIVAEEALQSPGRRQLADALARQPEWSDFPVIVMASGAGGSRPLTPMEALSANIIVVERPIRRITLLTTIRAAIRSRARQLQVRDELTRRRQVEEELLRADRRKDEFLATLSHELRNPLAPLITGLELLELTRADPAKQADIQAMMRRQATQLTRLVDDLVEVSRITRGELELRTGRVAVADVVQRAVEASDSLIREKRHSLAVSLPDEPIEIEADAVRLIQVISNLLNNAAKYMPVGGRIWLDVERADGEVLVSVRDEGFGIPADMHERIFEMFEQIDRPQERGTQGLGVGLSLVRTLVRMHGGDVEIRSDGPDAGSTFIVRLPERVDAADATLRSPEAEPGTSGEPHHVLVVDDNRAAARLLARVVQMLGHRARTAFDGEEAIAVARTERPDLVIMDLKMPTTNGYEAARRIRQEPWGRTMMLVALTGWAQEEHRLMAKQAGFDRHLVKPATAADLESLFAELSRAPGRDEVLPVSRGTDSGRHRGS